MPTGTQGTQAWDRYAFVNNNPVRYNDPTGHELCLTALCIGTALLPIAQFAQDAPDLIFSSWGKIHPTANGNVALTTGIRNGTFQNTFGLAPGGNYNPSTITSAAAKTNAWSAIKGSNVLISLGLSFGENVTSGEHEAFTQEFWTSVGVDAVLSIVTQVAVAAIVGGAFAIIGVAASPLLITALIIGGSMAAGYLLEENGINDTMEEVINQTVDAVEETVEEYKDDEEYE